jgi:L-rhamnose mutarotase
MILEVDDSFSFERKAALDNSNQKVQEWEALMWEFQQALPNTPPDSKWVLMDKIYDLNILE